MIRITRQTDYAILLLTQMASRPADDVHNAKDLARRTGLPLPMVSKILKALARSAVVVSLRGVKGGYRLTHRPDRIRIADVIAVFEGPIGITECTHAPGSCEQEEGCPVRPNWQKINVALREALSTVSLADMMPPTPLLRVESPAVRGEAGATRG